MYKEGKGGASGREEWSNEILGFFRIEASEAVSQPK
jgi:hypothetical protein